MSSKAERSGSVQSNARARGRILLIADNADFLANADFESCGLEIVGTANGVAAVVSLRRSRPHLVIASTDLHGISLKEIERILGQFNQQLPLILVGREPANLQLRSQAMTHGAFDYFQVPAETTLMLELSKRLVELQKQIEHLQSEADLDPLTGLANRRRFRAALKHEVERWRRYSAPCALLMLDIDNMKAINDRFGHPAGDNVIRHVASVLAEVSRDNDTAARLGGEEFALLLANVNIDKAATAAERLRVALSQQVIEGVGSITVSIGVAACPATANSERSLYTGSDAALYVAKNEGRNRVEIAPLLQENLPGV